MRAIEKYGSLPSFSERVGGALFLRYVEFRLYAILLVAFVDIEQADDDGKEDAF